MHLGESHTKVWPTCHFRKPFSHMTCCHFLHMRWTFQCPAHLLYIICVKWHHWVKLVYFKNPTFLMEWLITQGQPLFWFVKQIVLSSKTSSLGPTNSSVHCRSSKGGRAKRRSERRRGSLVPSWHKSIIKVCCSIDRWVGKKYLRDKWWASEDNPHPSLYLLMRIHNA